MSKTKKARKKTVNYFADKALTQRIAAQFGAMSRGMNHVPSAESQRIAKQMAEMTLGMYKAPRRKLSKTERAARGRVLSAHRASAARAARLPGKTKRSKKSPAKKTTARRTATRRAAPSAARPAARRSSKKVRTVTADAVIRAAADTAMKKWLCEGARRSGCGAGGSRVISGKGSFKRLRPARPSRFMTSG